ncbi:MAG: hypothetical protein BJ554DRAFT_4742 [Olpidium bornovanus]|uniref:Uncharacterized protein n=1 Tax=Olpidium bornovanus TaxID=278681 RepID=A0A8H8DL40_9FUNG|nr:MAG: hypothetical protein BJ554DRAFT_4742 [Olpidium bornovanus]
MATPGSFCGRPSSNRRAKRFRACLGCYHRVSCSIFAPSPPPPTRSSSHLPHLPPSRIFSPSRHLYHFSYSIP